MYFPSRVLFPFHQGRSHSQLATSMYILSSSLSLFLSCAIVAFYDPSFDTPLCGIYCEPTINYVEQMSWTKKNKERISIMILRISWDSMDFISILNIDVIKRLFETLLFKWMNDYPNIDYSKFDNLSDIFRSIFLLTSMYFFIYINIYILKIISSCIAKFDSSWSIISRTIYPICINSNNRCFLIFV